MSDAWYYWKMLLALIFFTVFILIVAWSSFTGAPWVPARKRDFGVLIEDAAVKSTDTVIELGCGDGRLLKAIARQVKQADGYEINPVLWFIAWIRCSTTKNAHVYLGNFWAVDLKGYDIVLTFLVPRTMPKLGKKAAEELSPGSRLVSYVFPIPGKKVYKKGATWYIYKY